MDNKEFTSKIAMQMGIDYAEAESIVAAFAETLLKSASSLDSIAIPAFGNFVAIKQREQIQIDRNTNKRMLLPPQIKVEFAASAMLKKQVAHE